MGAVVGITVHKEEYVSTKVSKWVEEQLLQKMNPKLLCLHSPKQSHTDGLM